MTSLNALGRHVDTATSAPCHTILTPSASPNVQEHSTGAGMTYARETYNGLSQRSSKPVHEPITGYPIHKTTHISADEPRLLGGRGQPIDPGAILISMPASKQLRTAMVAIPSGFAPTNTLTRGANTNHSTEPHRHDPGKKRNALEVEISAGGNVKLRARGPETALPQLSERQAKRQKHTPSLNSDRIDNSDDFDPLGPNGSNYIVSHMSGLSKQKPKTRSQGPSVYSISSKVDGKKESYSQTGVSEFTSVEVFMDSCKSKSRFRLRQRKGSFHKQSNTSMNALSLTNSSSLVGKNPMSTLPGDELSKTARPTPYKKYKGTARNPPNNNTHNISIANGRHGEHDTGKKSSYFSNSQASKNMVSQSRHIPPNFSIPINPNHESSLRDQFRDTNGKQRGSVIDNLSSDELGSCTTVGSLVNTERASLQKPSRSVSPTKTPYSTQQAMALKDIDPSLPPSNIPSSNFTTYRPESQNKKISFAKIAQSTEKDSFSNIELDGYIEDGKFVETKCHLVFSRAEMVLSIVENSGNATSKKPNLSIQLQKLQRIFWSSNSLKVRLIFSKCVGSDHILDIQFRGEKDVGDFVSGCNRLAIHARTEINSEDHMEKIFAKRLLEQKKFPRTYRTVSAEDALDLQPATPNLQRWMESTSNDSLEQTDPKRRRTVVSRLHGTHDDDGDQAKPRSIQQQCKSETIKEDVSEELTNITKIIRGLHPQTPNRHLRSSRIQPNSETRRFDSAAEEFPPSLRYSQKEGLGKVWLKPLVYPKNGKKKNTVDFHDLERLDEGQFLNDNLIGFYLRFLEHQLEETKPELAKKVYFFNTFFFASLTNTQERQKLINYEAVQKWTRSVDIFGYDYVVVPINESAHWYVAIICNLSALIPGLMVSDESIKDAIVPTADHKEGRDQAKTPPVEPEGLSSSPPTDVVVEENVSLIAERSNDQDPTASFAEMTLENGLDKPPISKNRIHAKGASKESDSTSGIDQYTLNVQIERNMAEYAEDSSQEIDNVKEVSEAEHAAQEQTPRLSTLSKKRKRKSIPPIMKHNPNSPTILTFDSLGLPHTSTTRILKEYLRHEGRAKRGFSWDEMPIKGITAKEIPEQSNFCDCGLFLLGYIDKFLEDPKEFVSKIIKREYDRNKDWPRMIPKDLRTTIREEIQKLHREQEADRRDNAKKTNKYHGKQDRVHQSPLRGSAPLNSKESKTKGPLPSMSVVIPENTSTRWDTTPVKARENALPINEENPEYSIKSYSKQSDQDSIDILDDDPSDVKNDDPLVVILDSQPDQAESKPTHQLNLNPVAKPSLSSKIFAEVSELPSVIQDSQPDSFRDSRSRDSPQRLPQSPGLEIDDSTHHIGRTRSPSVGHQSEELQKPIGPSSRPSKQKQRESSVIQLD